MRTLEASEVKPADLDEIEKAALQLPKSDLADALLAMFAAVRSGQDVCLAPSSEGLSPSRAAGLLGMSRAHLYKLLDAGEIAYARVGRDRRIAMSDLAAYKSRRDLESKALAERFAHPDRVDAAALQAIEEMLD